MSTHFPSIIFSLRIEIFRFAEHCASVLSNSVITSLNIVEARQKELAVVEGASLSVGVAGACLVIAFWLLHQRSVSARHQARQAVTDDNPTDFVHQPIVDLAQKTMAGAGTLPRRAKQESSSLRPDVFTGTIEEQGIVDSISRLARRGWNKLRRLYHNIRDFRADSFAGNLLNASLHRLGYEKRARPFSDFITFKETQNAAKAAGISVAELIERKHVVGSKTALQQTMEGMASLGVFGGNVDRVCEIGPGSGRYLEQILKRCKPKEYEIYETSQEWRGWLVEGYPVVARKCDGKSLSETETASVDLVQAHKVFPGLPTLMTLSYLREMARVVREGGWIVFDIMTEQCFDAPHLQAWFAANPWEWDWSPRMSAVQYVVDLFGEHGISLTGSFLVPLYPAVTECLVLRKEA
jgi:phospholipid N-methyltransferase